MKSTNIIFYSREGKWLVEITKTAALADQKFIQTKLLKSIKP